MKKLLILTAVVMLTSSAVGCRCCDWLWRGAAYNPCAPMTTYGRPAMPGNPCDPCATAPPMMPIPGQLPYTGPPGS